jgi:ATP-dependent DNA helicase PIF1
MELMKLEGKGTIFVANDFAIDPRDLRKLDDSLMAPNSIELRVGAQVMLIKNLHQSGLFNGMIGTVKSIEADSVYVIFSSDGFIITHCITRELFELERNGQVFAKRSQLPLILSYAMSIHKSQGQTLKYVNVDLERVFESGQAYVALSRCTSLAGLQVKNFHPDKVKVNSKVVEFYQKYNLN